MPRIILHYGLLAGLIVGFIMLAVTMPFHARMPAWLGMTVGYTSMLVAFSMIFLAIKRHRDVDRGGVIRFLPALGIGLGISVIAGLIYTLTWELSQAITGGDFMAEYTAGTLARMRAEGASAAEIATTTTEMKAFAVQYADPLFRLPVTFAEIFPVGVLVSLVSAGLLCNRRFLPARHGAEAKATPAAEAS